MDKDELNRLSQRWHDLSYVCWCRTGRTCSACAEQDAIQAKATAAGWNLFTKQRDPFARV